MTGGKADLPCWRRRASAVALHGMNCACCDRFVRRCIASVAQFTLARRCKPCKHWRTIGLCPSYPQLPVELPRFYSLAVLLGDPVALLLVDLLWSLNVAKKRERDSMTVLVGFCQSNVNSAIALWIVFAIRFTRKDILNIAFVVCQWALGSTFCLAYIATQQCAALISNLPHIDQ